MVVLNYTGGEINAKIVYYGPGVSGKTTNLEFIHEKTPANAKGKMVSMKTQTDRTLFFDFLPLELGEINGYRTRFLLYTVPGQVYYNATRKLVLKGADAIVFVADSARTKLDENLESLRNLEQNLNEHGMTLDEIPWVIQYNKRDLADAVPVSELDARLNPLKKPSFEAVANKGTGVYETFHGIATMVYRVLKDRLEKGELSTEAGAAAPAHLTEAAPPAVARPAEAAPSPHTALGDALKAVMAPKRAAAPVAPTPTPPPPPAPVPAASRVAADPPAAEGAEFEFDDHVDLMLREMEHEHPTKPIAPAPSARPAPAAAPAPARPAPATPSAAAETPADDGLFAAIPESPFDIELGRLPELDEASIASETAREEGPDEFVTDPMRHVKPKPAPAKVPVTPAAKAPEQPRAKTAAAVAIEPAPETRAPEPRPAKQPAAPAPAPAAPAPVAAAPVTPAPTPAAPAVQPRAVAPAVAPVPAPASVPPEPEPRAPSPSLQSTQEVREVRVAVPLVLTREQLEGGAPIRVVLDVKIVD